MSNLRPNSGPLDAAQDRFIASWGQMGSTWGINRTMAEVHALLYITARPLCTDDVMERLEISRGNASMSLRALVDWAIVSRVHKRGDRKEYYQAEGDPWGILKAVIAERMKREIHPVLASLAEIRDSTDVHKLGLPEQSPELEAVATHNRRLDGMIELLQIIDGLGEKFLDLPVDQMRQAASVLGEMSTGGEQA
jgi:HTH-type transcriptional regulator, glycine betaine synthesis regulator